jgi:hypothetical protein
MVGAQFDQGGHIPGDTAEEFKGGIRPSRGCMGERQVSRLA